MENQLTGPTQTCRGRTARLISHNLSASAVVSAALGAFLSSMVPSVVSAEERDPMLLYDQDGLKVRSHLQFGLNAVAEDNLFWNLAAVTAPTSGFDPDTEWLEGYVKPGLSFERTLDSGAVFYDKLSAVASYT